MTNTREINENLIKKIPKIFLSLFGYKIVKTNNFNDRYADLISEANEEETKDIN